MLKFFRTIRQNLINEGKTARYLKYAIGEIVLVVIGILIALQINNWNDERKEAILDEALRKEYIRDLYSEMQSNIFETERLINSYKQSRDGSEYLLKYIEGDCLKLGNINHLNEAQRKIFEGKVVNRASAYYEMRISGKLNKIKHDSLLNKLEDYYSLNNEILIQNQNYISLRSDLVFYMMENSPLKEKYNFYDENGYSFKFMEDLYHQERYIKLLRKVYSISRGGINLNLRLKDGAQIIIDYMDKHYSDVLKNQ